MENQEFQETIAHQKSSEYQDELKYAGFWRRVAANFIDSFIIFGILVIICSIIGIDVFESYTYGGSANYNVGVQLTTASSIIMMIVDWLYFASFESSTKQATPGKMALGIIVTDYEGERISFGKALGRKFAKILSTITLGIGYIMAAFTEQKQALHDMVAGTLVVQK
ncbi:MAG TPA: RDD family protein [Clostridiales bacterium]|nr:RDD family protein [Clostridiales bacterium]